MPQTLEFIFANWDAPEHIVALCTTRQGGLSANGFASLNLASHVHDVPELVDANRQRLIRALNLPAQPEWLNQTHSTRVIDLDHETMRDGDAACTSMSGKIAAVLTADCLPVLFCNTAGDEVAAAHAGWRGLANGVLEQTVRTMRSSPGNIMAWLGPAIGPTRFEVGAEVRQAFLDHDIEAESCFSLNRPGHYLADLYRLARLRLNKAGIDLIWGGEYCTYLQNRQFFSYRREKVTGRQASLIYIK
jgi:YfiH family protein